MSAPNESLQNRVLVALRSLILSGKFDPGERLTEVALAKKLHVSRTPVRLALATLEKEGLTEANATGGYIMRGVTPREIEDAITIRGTLEGLAARMLAEQGPSRRLLADMKQCLAEGDELLSKQHGATLEDYTRYTDINDRLHALILEGAHSDVLERTMAHVLCMPFAAPSALVSGPAAEHQGIRWLIIAHHQHHALVEAIEQGQSGRAQAIAEEHVNIARENIQAIFDNPEIAKKLIPAIRLPRTTPEPTPARAGRRTHLTKGSD